MQRITVTLVAPDAATPHELADRLKRHANEAATAINGHETRADLMHAGRGGEADRWHWTAELFNIA